MALTFCGKRLFINRSNLLANQVRNGYIVLVPEIGEDSKTKNPLLRDDNLPEFNNITIERCVAAIHQQTNDIEKSVKSLEKSLPQPEETTDDQVASKRNIFQDILIPLEQISAPLETTWGLAKVLYLGNSSLMPTKSYMTIHERARRARFSKFNSATIYSVLKNVDNNVEFTEEEIRVRNKYLLEAKLNGMELDESSKHQLNDILDKLGKERAKFHNKADLAVKQFSHVIKNPEIMQEFPPTLRQALAIDKSQSVKGPWKITLQPYLAKKFLEYCPDRTLRWNIWQADTRKCSGYNDKSLDNSVHLEEIRSFRNRQAKLLGYDNFAKMSMETKMAGSVENVKKFLENLLKFAKSAQENELQALEAFANENGFKGKLESHDVPYWRRRHSDSLCKIDDESIREYFPLPNVLGGLFTLAEKLFDVKIKERTGVDTWHEDVKYYDVFDGNIDSQKTPIAGFYTDLYSREDEKNAIENTGWMVGIRNRSVFTEANPLAALICNFEAPLYGKPSLLSIDDVKLLFHKFGHALQHLLTQTRYSEVAGLSNIEWDVVEVSGHVMSHLLYNPDTIKLISSHYSTRDPLPEQYFNAIKLHRQHMAGYDLCRELYYSELDLELHTKKDFWLDVVKNLWPQYQLLAYDKKDSHPCSFRPIFSGEWAAAYYSHIWSRVLAADIYSAFYEAHQNNQDITAVGRRYRDTFLALGGSCHPSEIFRRFRGRDPSPKALLTALGLYKKNMVAPTSAKTDTKAGNAGKQE
uniref:Putative oligopeptidase n=1 Tax=Corethrella appendiculata TaxID=1370023 RepID=U5EY96_9DIPT